MSQALVHARQHGKLKLCGRDSQRCCRGARHKPGRASRRLCLWECKEFLELIDVSQNELTALPEQFGSLCPQTPSVGLSLIRLRCAERSTPAITSLATFRAPRIGGSSRRWSTSTSRTTPRTAPHGFGADNLPPLVRLDATHNQLQSVPPSSAR